nr:cobalamin-dependent protein [Candidatus Omnitrophota bacterium]
MKTLFLTPQLGSWATHGHHVAPNQMHASWAAYAREKGTIQPEVLDCKALNIPFDAMLEQVKAKNPEVVVLGDVLHSYGGFAVQKYFNDTAQAVKKILPKTKIVVGGLWYSFFGKETLQKDSAIDFVVMGEGEITFNDLMEALNKGKTDFSDIPGLSSRHNGSVVFGPIRDLIKN